MKYFFLLSTIFLNLFCEQSNSKNEYALQEAAKSADWESLKKLLKIEKVNPNFQDENEFTPLINAIRSNKANVKDVQLLLESGANVNTTTKLGISALSSAIYNQNARIAELLMEHGAKIDKSKLMKNTVINAIIPYSGIKDVSKTKAIIMFLIKNGFNYKDPILTAKLNNKLYEKNKIIFEQAKAELIKEYKEKINKAESQQQPELSTALQEYLPKDLIPMIAQYSHYTDDQILDNIIQIRTFLGEIQ